MCLIHINNLHVFFKFRLIPLWSLFNLQMYTRMYKFKPFSMYFIWNNSQLLCLVNRNVGTCTCRSPDRNLGTSGICLGQIGILFWPKVILGQIRIPIWQGRFRICLGQMGIFNTNSYLSNNDSEAVLIPQTHVLTKC